MTTRKRRPDRFFVVRNLAAQFLRHVLGRHRPVPTKGSILLVDDELALLESLKQLLKEHFVGFSILTASDGIMARERLRQNPVSLVITNLNMPGMNGFQLLDHIKAHYPGLPVIILTGMHSPEKSELARRKGAVAYLRKPCRLEDLVGTIRYFI